MISGIYKIINLTNNKIYIGSSKSLNKRKVEHFSRLRVNAHSNKKLQRSFNKYGEQNFKFETLEFNNESNLISREQYYIDTLNPEFNICKIAGRITGLIRTKNWRDKISKSHIGKKASIETRLKQSKAKLGKSPSNKGIKCSEETKQKIKDSIAKLNRVAWNKGIPCRNETKLKLSLKNTGRVQSEVEKLKRGISNKGKKSKAIIQYNLNGNFIKEFNSITEASLKTNVSLGSIHNSCNKNKPSCNFIWQYKEAKLCV